MRKNEGMRKALMIVIPVVVVAAVITGIIVFSQQKKDEELTSERRRIDKVETVKVEKGDLTPTLSAKAGVKKAGSFVISTNEKGTFKSKVKENSQVTKGQVLGCIDSKEIKAPVDAPVKYAVGFNRRYDHNFAAIRDSVENGKVGDVHVVKITSRDPEPPGIDYVKVSGGMFLDMTIHDFDMVRYLTGCDVTEVYTQANVLINPAIGEAGDVDTKVMDCRNNY